jgi:hypothetical protein
VGCDRGGRHGDLADEGDVVSTYDIFDLASDGRAIVYADRRIGIVVTWNGSQTYEVWGPVDDGGFQSIDVFTHCHAQTLAEAVEVAAVHYAEIHRQYAEDTNGEFEGADR